MESIQNLVLKFQKEKPPPHEKAAIVNEILSIVGKHKVYNYGYWLRQIGDISFGRALDIIKEASQLDSKYNKGGYITNKFAELNGRRKQKTKEKVTNDDKK